MAIIGLIHGIHDPGLMTFARGYLAKVVTPIYKHYLIKQETPIYSSSDGRSGVQNPSEEKDLPQTTGGEINYIGLHYLALMTYYYLFL